jgi:inorganic triphosphatase YgiF
MPIEVELKFRADTEAALETLAARVRLGGARLGPAVTVDEEDRYLDTVDGRLAAARWACRLRTRGDTVIASLKGPPEADVTADGLHRRPEVEGPALATLDPSRWPASPARDFVLRLSGGTPLHEILRLRQRRTERAVEAEGVRLGTLSLDRVDVEHDDHRLMRLFVVELELDADAAAGHARSLGAALASVDGMAPDPRTKLEHALAALAAAGR